MFWRKSIGTKKHTRERLNLNGDVGRGQELLRKKFGSWDLKTSMSYLSKIIISKWQNRIEQEHLIPNPAFSLHYTNLCAMHSELSFICHYISNPRTLNLKHKLNHQTNKYFFDNTGGKNTYTTIHTHTLKRTL